MHTSRRHERRTTQEATAWCTLTTSGWRTGVPGDRCPRGQNNEKKKINETAETICETEFKIICMPEKHTSQYLQQYFYVSNTGFCIPERPRSLYHVYEMEQIFKNISKIVLRYNQRKCEIRSLSCFKYHSYLENVWLYRSNSTSYCNDNNQMKDNQIKVIIILGWCVQPKLHRLIVFTTH